MDVRGFVVDAQYRIEGTTSYVMLYGRLEDGRSFATRNAYEPYFAIKKADEAVAKKILKGRARLETHPYRTPDDKPTLRVVAKSPKDVPDLRRLLEDEDVTCYEADIRFVRRFLIDHDIRGDVRIRGPSDEHERADLYFEEPQLEGCAPVDIELRVMSIDIETNADATQLYSIAAVDSDDARVFIISEDPVSGADHYPDTKSLIEAFYAYVLERDPDLITGWNVVDFDLARIRDYAEHVRIGRVDQDAVMRIYSDFLKTSTAHIPGRQVLDGIELLRTSWVNLEDYTLQTASRELLGESKELEGDRRDAITDAYRNRPEELVSYNLKDARLVVRILEKLDLIRLTIERSRISGLLMDEVRGAVASLDSMYLRELKAHGHVYYSVRGGEREARIRGGFVMDSEPGLYENVLVFDFKSLYPSIIATFNIDPMTHRNDGSIEAPNKARFRAEPEGIMPRLITQLSDLRDEAKRDGNDIRSFALKITMNSMFGVLANPNCRFYSLELANAITHFGQTLIKHTADELEKRGYAVIYGDTDSVFVNVKTADEHEAERIGTELEQALNSHFETYISDTWGVTSQLTLQFERRFARFWMPRVRGSDAGSKKRYAGLVKSEKGESIKITGLEYVRRDWTQAARDFQYELLDLLFHDGDPQSFVREYITALKSGSMDEKLVYRKAIRKGLDEYTKTTPPHVRAARKLEKLESNIIDYYMTVNGPEPVQKHESQIDYEHYVDKQIKPLAQAILTTIGLDFERILEGVDQKSLFGWE
ncbi:MAG: DNA polymerase II [Candidatus Woesearchaeota archaeon]